MMTVTPLSKQYGQGGLLVSLAGLTLISAIAAVAYTVISSTQLKEHKEKSEPANNILETFSEEDIGNIKNKLTASFLSNRKQFRSENISAISNTLSNLKNIKSPLAVEILKLLDNGQLVEAITALTALALITEKKREAAKLWVDIGNLENLKSTEKATDAYQKGSTLDSDNINAWNRIGHIERQNKHFDLAEIAYGHVTRLSKKNTPNQALSWANFGLLYQTQHKYKDAINAFEQSLSINTHLENNLGIASSSENLSALYRTPENFNFEKADKHYQQALQIYKSEGQISKQIEIHASLGNLYQSQQQAELALLEYEKALNLTTEKQDTKFSASLYSNMGILAQQNNELEKAGVFFNKSLTLFKELKQAHGTANQYSNLAILARNNKAFEESESLHLKAIELYHSENHQGSITTQYTNLGFLYTAWDKQESACEYWQKSLERLISDTDLVRKSRITAIVEKDCPVRPTET